MRRRRHSRGMAKTGSPSVVSPSMTMVPSRASRLTWLAISCVAETVLMIRSNCSAAAFMASASELIRKCRAPIRSASAFLRSEVDSTVTSAPRAAASLTAIWPRPPRPITATFDPGPTPQVFSGDQVVTPAHSRGAAASSGRLSGILSTKA